MELRELISAVKQFNQERDWDQFHHPKDLLLALVSEVGELAECYRWLTDTDIARVHADPAKKKKVEEELADIFLYLIMLAYKTDTDLLKVVAEKLEKNRKKYPVAKSKGVHSNPIEGFKGHE